jgi:phosphatidate cytidylyltransferase
MLRTRLWMGAILVGLVLGVLVLDQRLAPWYPFLMVLVLVLATLACHEMLQLLSGPARPVAWLCFTAVVALILVNWAPVWPQAAEIDRDPRHWMLGTMAVVVLVALVTEMAVFQEPGKSVGRIALAVWVAAYLGLLPGFFAQLRWVVPPRGWSGNAADPGTLALALAIFVPKCGDIGAYFTGRLVGRHKMAPVLSPKKTWEGALGGLVVSVAASVGINRLGPVLAGGLLAEVSFGLTVGAAGIVGDLAESLIKRDCRRKDASQVVPGFGGVLDLIDSVVFAAPIAYCWLK